MLKFHGKIFLFRKYLPTSVCTVLSFRPGWLRGGFYLFESSSSGAYLHFQLVTICHRFISFFIWKNKALVLTRPVVSVSSSNKRKCSPSFMEKLHRCNFIGYFLSKVTKFWNINLHWRSKQSSLRTKKTISYHCVVKSI